MIISELYPVIKENCAWREVGGSVLIVDTVHFDKNKLISLNESGSFVWKAINGSASVGSIVDQMVAEYDVTKETAENDVSEFITTMVDKKLVKLSGNTESELED